MKYFEISKAATMAGSDANVTLNTGSRKNHPIRCRQRRNFPTIPWRIGGSQSWLLARSLSLSWFMSTPLENAGILTSCLLKRKEACVATSTSDRVTGDRNEVIVIREQTPPTGELWSASIHPQYRDCVVDEYCRYLTIGILVWRCSILRVHWLILPNHQMVR